MPVQGEEWIRIDKQALLCLENQELRSPSTRGAVEAICDRLLMREFIVKCGGVRGKGLELSDEIQAEMRGPWTQFARRLVYGLFNHGFVVYSNTGLEVFQQKSAITGASTAATNAAQASQVDATPSKYVGVGGPSPYRIETDLIDIYVHFSVNGHPRYRVHASRSADNRIPLQNVFVAEMTSPTARGQIRSAAATIAQTGAMGVIARTSAAAAWQRSAVPAVFTEVDHRGVADRAADPNLSAFEDAYAMRELEQARVASLSRGGMPVDNDDVVPSRPQDPLTWTDRDAVLADMPRIIGTNAELVPPANHLPPGRKIAHGVVGNAPAAYLGQIEAEIDATAMAAGVPGEAFSRQRNTGNMTVVAVEAGMSQFDTNVHKFGVCASLVLEHMLQVSYGALSAAEHMIAGRIGTGSVEETVAGMREMAFTVSFTRAINFNQINALLMMGGVSPKTWRRYAARSLFMPEEDLLEPVLDDARQFGPQSKKTRLEANGDNAV